jgi:hypothetical protein
MERGCVGSLHLDGMLQRRHAQRCVTQGVVIPFLAHHHTVDHLSYLSQVIGIWILEYYVPAFSDSTLNNI